MLKTSSDLPFTQKPSLQKALSKIIMAYVTTTVSYQLIYLKMLITTTVKNKLGVFKFLKINYQTTRRVTQFSSIVFTTKIIIDELCNMSKKIDNEFKKGAITGLISYLINRPLDQMELIRHNVFVQEKKYIDRMKALKIVQQNNGFKGFYKRQNILAPLSSVLHHSIYFGLFWKLHNYDNSNLIITYTVYPFAASFFASLMTIPIDKSRQFYFQSHQEADKSIQKIKKYQKTSEKQPLKLTITMKFIIKILQGQIHFNLSEIKAISYSILKNSFLLSAFCLGQQMQKRKRLFYS